MDSVFLVALVSFVIALIVTPLWRNAAGSWGWVDSPDGRRKLHRQPIPSVGGVPILFTYLASLGILLLTPLSTSAIVQDTLPLMWRLGPAIVIIFLIGLIDDLWGLRPWQKLTGQIVAAVSAWLSGVQIHHIAGQQLESWWSLSITVGWFLLCTNAFNLIDGVDGLASGLGLFATVTILVAALLDANVSLALATAPLAGSLLGFLRYNFNPASIFLGDSGSLFIGFLLGCYGIIWSQKSATLLGMTAPLMALAIPILDVLLSVLRRFLRGQPVFGADRGHIHHRLLDRGLTPRRVALLLYGVCSIFAALSLLQSAFENEYAGLILILFCCIAWIGVQTLGYVEFGLARRLLLGGAFQNMLNGQLILRQFDTSLAAARTVEDCWKSLCHAGGELGLQKVEMYVGGTRYVQQIGSEELGKCWSASIPLSGDEWVRLTREFHASVTPMIVGPFVDRVHEKLDSKLREIEALAPTRIHIGRDASVRMAKRTVAVGSSNT